MTSPGSRRTRAERVALAARMKAEQQAAERRRRQLWVTGGVALAVVLIVLASIAIYRSTSSAGGSDAAAPAHATADGGLVAPGPTTDGEVPHVVVYADFLCPICGAFEAETGPWLAEQVAAGEIELEHRPIAILDEASSTDYSTRATNAAACVADEAGLEAFVAMHDELFAQQPEEGGPGLPDDTLVELAVDAGADQDAVASCIEDGSFDDWVAQVTDRASDDGVTGTPTVLVDGEQVASGGVPTLADMEQAVAAAR